MGTPVRSQAWQELRLGYPSCVLGTQGGPGLVPAVVAVAVAGAECG